MLFGKHNLLKNQLIHTLRTYTYCSFGYFILIIPSTQTQVKREGFAAAFVLFLHILVKDTEHQQQLKYKHGNLSKHAVFGGSADGSVRNVFRSLFMTQVAPMWWNGRSCGQRRQVGPQQHVETNRSSGSSAPVPTHPESGGHLDQQPPVSQDKMRRIQRLHPAGDPYFRGTFKIQR